MTQTISLNHITKIEGHASLRIVVEKGKVKKCNLSSVEGARYFEELLIGRDYTEAFELTSRICGICSSAHVICSITAVENALGMKASEQTLRLRELLTLGERIRSHATHLYFLALPDYLGYESAMAMIPKYTKEIERALRLMKIGNLIVKIIGGRDLHPVSAHVGGFSSFPREEEIQNCQKELQSVLKDAIKTAKLFMKLKFQKFEREIEMFSLTDSKGYAMLHGDLTSGKHVYKQSEFEKYFSEFHEPHSTSKFALKEGKEYRVGALSRLNHNSEQLFPYAKKMLKKSKLRLPSYNPFLNNLAQAIELVHAIEHAIHIFSSLKIRSEKIRKPVLKKSCKGIAGIEVPRGILWHEYEFNAKGKITKANIITPTSQNVRAIQEDIRTFLPTVLHLSRPEIELEIEKLIRSYDPCFSCSTHFLDVKWEE
ncbi:Ni/Fe hydrogenase subunit alpha [Candidatus Peregrinibacteria bacterium]|nr:Ni/Fe hydrogenase subunit alpha [Candidatus Peregrinibacteria bacterium]